MGKIIVDLDVELAKNKMSFCSITTQDQLSWLFFDLERYINVFFWMPTSVGIRAQAGRVQDSGIRIPAMRWLRSRRCCGVSSLCSNDRLIWYA